MIEDDDDGRTVADKNDSHSLSWVLFSKGFSRMTPNQLETTAFCATTSRQLITKLSIDLSSVNVNRYCTLRKEEEELRRIARYPSLKAQ